jgi:ankyrin repeat protein
MKHSTSAVVSVRDETLTALHLAVMSSLNDYRFEFAGQKRVRMAMSFIASGIYLEARDSDGRTPIHE